MKQESFAWFSLKGLARPQVNFSVSLQSTLLSSFFPPMYLIGISSTGIYVNVIGKPYSTSIIFR